MGNELTDISIIISTCAVAVFTFFLWRSTNKVAEATKAVKEATREVASYTIMPHFSIYEYRLEKQGEEYDQFEFRIVNDGLGDAFNINLEIKSSEMSSSIWPTFKLSKDYTHIVGDSVKKNSQNVNFKIKFEDVAGNRHERALSFKIPNRVKCDWTRVNPSGFSSDVVL